ncbi:TraR/DksA family transcriptional regulator [Rhizobium leguminosarum]|nr:TraR/DksA C4-type zinc finger protein [Rhizobium leguminosarum]
MQVEGVDQIATVDVAILRIESGIYGHCMECESGIGAERLKAMPYTTF